MCSKSYSPDSKRIKVSPVNHRMCLEMHGFKPLTDIPNLDLREDHTQNQTLSDDGPEHTVGHSTCRRLAPSGPSI